jgi:hypothetical protein
MTDDVDVDVVADTGATSASECILGAGAENAGPSDGGPAGGGPSGGGVTTEAAVGWRRMGVRMTAC